MPKEQKLKWMELGSDEGEVFFIKHLDQFTYLPKKPEFAESPHRHNFHELIWVRSGKGSQDIDGQLLKVEPLNFYLIAKGQVHQFLQAESVDAYVVRFTDDFRPVGYAESKLHFIDVIFNNVRTIPALQIAFGDVAVFDSLFSMMMREFDAPDGFGKKAVLRHLLYVTLIKIGQTLGERLDEYDEADSPDDLFQGFLALLEQSFKAHHDVAYYAAELAVTPRQLSERTKRVIGKTAKQLIEDRVTLEAKRNLRFTNKSIKTVAYELGFDDPSYFSKVFKRVTSLTPQNFIDQLSM